MSELPSPRTSIGKVMRDIKVPVRDGVLLATDVYLPRSSGPAWPCILIRTPYGKQDESERAAPLARILCTQDFAVAVQDMRGTGGSTGSFKAYSNAEGPDGFDTLDWLVSQSWCSGRVGTVGCSYLGEVQDMLAAMRHPQHTAAFIEGAYTFNDGTMRAFSFLRNGVIELAYAVGGDAELLGTLPLSEIRRKLPRDDASYYAQRWPDTVDAWLTRDSMDAYWDDDGGVGPSCRFDVPAIHINEWYSVPFSSIRMFQLYRENGDSARARDHQYLILSPMTHCGTAEATASTIIGERDLGDARFDYFGTMIRWFDYWLRDVQNDVPRMPKVQAYLMGRNEWQQFPCWPPPGTQERDYFICSDGLLSDAGPPPAAAVDSFVYDPADPTPSCGGPVLGGRVFRPGAFDQRLVEQRKDVLVYSTPVLQEGVQVSGRVRVVLHVSSTACDTDFTAKLVDVYADGRAFNVLEGILRMRYRHSLAEPQLLRPGCVYEVSIDLDSTSNWFAPGHRIRLEVASANFPRFDRNLNTGSSGSHSCEHVVATNTVHHGGARPSRVVLPVVDARASAHGSYLSEPDSSPLRRPVLESQLLYAGNQAVAFVDGTKEPLARPGRMS